MLQLPTEPKNLMTWSSLGRFIEMAYPLTYDHDPVKPIDLNAYRSATTFEYPLCKHMTEAKLVVNETIEHAVFTCSHDLSCSYHSSMAVDIYGLLNRNEGNFYAELYPATSSTTMFNDPEDYVMAEDDSIKSSSGSSSTQFSMVQSETGSSDSFIVSDTSDITIYTDPEMPSLAEPSDSSEASSVDSLGSNLPSSDDEDSSDNEQNVSTQTGGPNGLPVIAPFDPTYMLQQMDDANHSGFAHRLAVLRPALCRYLRRVVLTDSGDSSSDSG
ncbi:hypothetical protein BKA70DRAFT_1230830 [Coprinopsis sp. MPI-PUGE-AT-0042]|nr:hypothetical protein BKA70DRAFT_1230830 [Coprinopsis sp. MPI-PUGE-AT-0042]